ncbi:uncharacterized protein LOC111255177 [Varroa destructor]|uniref:Uncharacterized protein n=1 Tax=Varroa destructor TaxID=109461 RepID=A0A7M7KYR6_VARDE|nr:uncharacterized protein LOC111255177 [Varroa destructor]
MVSYEKHLFACYNMIVQRHVGEAQGTNKVTMSLVELQAVRRLQSNLSKTVLKSDDLFQKMAFFWTGLFVIGVCLEVTRYYNGKASDPDFDDPNELLQLFVNLMNFFMLFISLSIFGAKLTETAHACTMLVHRMINHAPTEENLELFSQAHLLVAQMNKPEIAMSGWNFFTFSRNFILTIGGALISYILLIIQMAPSKVKDVTVASDIKIMASLYNATASTVLNNITTRSGTW